MKSIKLNNFAAYGLAQILISFAINLAVKADYGIAVATSPAFVLSHIISGVSFGTFNYLYQGFIFLLMLIIIREVKLRFFLSFLTAVIFGYLIDFWAFLLRNLSFETPVERILILILSMVIMGLAIASFIVSGLPILPFDIFVRKISEKFNLSFIKVKLVFDLSNLIVAVCLSLLFLGKLVGIYWGTLAFSLVLGPLIGFYMSQYHRFVVITK